MPADVTTRLSDRCREREMAKEESIGVEGAKEDSWMVICLMEFRLSEPSKGDCAENEWGQN